VSSPARGEVWSADLSPTFGHEQSGRRPVLVVSVDPFNAGPSGLAVVIPITSKRRHIALHVPVDPPEGGLIQPSALLCDAVQSIDRRRFVDLRGAVTPHTLAEVETRLRLLFGL
jgi:mRNA interferase MazF